MNKTAEAREILKPVLKEVPTDDGTIQALSICYRELDERKLIFYAKVHYGILKPGWNVS